MSETQQQRITIMTWDQLAERINQMTPEERKLSAGIAMMQTGEVAHVKRISTMEDFNGVERKDQLIIIYDDYTDF
jgi:DNA replication initiation complex subunit (GINS family)